MLGDDLIDARDPLLSRMIEVSLGQSATVVALMEVEPVADPPVRLRRCRRHRPTPTS